MSDDSGAIGSLLDLDRLIHEPARLTILSQLFVVEAADFVFLMRQTGMTQGNLSSHLAKLEEASYIRVTKEFVGKRPRTLIEMSPKGRGAFDSYLARMREALGAL